MKLRSLTSVIAFASVMQAMTVFAPAQDVSVKATIPFEFTVGKKAFPAGTYKLIHRQERDRQMELASADDKHLASMLVLTRLAAQHQGDSPKASLVFDVIKDKHFLSEVWFKDIDGYMVSTTTQEHKHAIANQD